MSHTTSIKSIKIMDIAALRAAVNALANNGVNISLQEGGKPRAYYSTQEGMGAADFVIRLPGAAYDIGLYKDKDGSYEARTDFHRPWDKSKGCAVEDVLGVKASDSDKVAQAKLGKLYAEYAAQATIMKARAAGYTGIRRVMQKDGSEKIIMNLAS